MPTRVTMIALDRTAVFCRREREREGVQRVDLVQCKKREYTAKQKHTDHVNLLIYESINNIL